MRICLQPSLNPRLAKHTTTLDLLCLLVQELFHGRFMPTDISQCTHHAKVFSGVFLHLGRNKRCNKQPSCFGKETEKVPASFPTPQKSKYLSNSWEGDQIFNNLRNGVQGDLFRLIVGKMLADIGRVKTFSFLEAYVYLLVTSIIIIQIVLQCTAVQTWEDAQF